MSSVSYQSKPALRLGFGGLTIILAALFFISIPVFWAAGTLYGWTKGAASNGFYLFFIAVYAGVLLLPWLNLDGQRGMSRLQRLGKMCVAWLCLEIAAACFWSGPWLIFPKAIVAGRGQMWAYGWWAYMDGGDARYTVTDASLIAMERMGIVVAVACAIVLLRRLVNGKFTNLDLWTLMFFQVAEFGVICVYYLSALYLDLSALGGASEIVIKYVGSNIFWFFMPPVVFAWAGQLLMKRHVQAARAGAAPFR